MDEGSKEFTSFVTPNVSMICKQTLGTNSQKKNTPGAIEPDPKRVTAILELRNPESVKELQCVIGTIMYYADYIPNLADIMDALYDLLKKDTISILTRSVESQCKLLKSV
ncbi:hypothetical protein B4U80_14015 [Leptotrombidium deliense]|uniref:Uncharacterized protein n=1 Tax=Leptotrombidium deliense TaxID=299467 RepID=A0A443S4Z7_9ACAR|nr:hypothetical protein B4U80_14015 [Leptotrombidium deliense]